MNLFQTRTDGGAQRREPVHEEDVRSLAEGLRQDTDLTIAESLVVAADRLGMSDDRLQDLFITKHPQHVRRQLTRRYRKVQAEIERKQTTRNILANWMRDDD